MTLLAAARKHLKVDAFIQQTDDAHGSEYTCPADNRRPAVSGFSGSAGTAAFTKTEAALWTDGRYFLQASQELDSDWTMMKDGLPETMSIPEWLLTKVPEGGVIGCDGLCTRFNAFESMKKEFAAQNRTLKAIDNPIDGGWTDRPARPANQLEIMGVESAGQSWQDKLAAVRVEIKKKHCAGLIITMLDEICWLFNVRGSDIPFNPLFFAYCYVAENDVILFMNEKQATPEIRKHLTGVTIKPYDQTLAHLKSLSTRTLCSGNSPSGIVHACADREVITDTPVSILKSIKNSTEIAGMLEANIRSAICHARLLKWAEDNAGTGVTECDGVDKLAGFYAEQKDFRGQSFDTISSTGANGAIIHYKPTRGKDAQIGKDVYLLDAGAHYTCGTTDTTRTVHCGEPTEFQKECYTRVLMGHINLLQVVFPSGTRGPALDVLSRSCLWDAGLEFKHGTGHGIGCWLNVHEPPVGLYLSPRADCVAQSVNHFYKPGYCVTDEPGFYKEGEFGMRIENAIYVVEAETKFNLPTGTQFYKFESFCFVPMCLKLIEPSLMTQKQKDWLNNYHQQCRDKLIPRIKEQGGLDDLVPWIEANTTPV